MHEKAPSRRNQLAVALAAVVTIATAAIATSLPSLAGPDRQASDSTDLKQVAATAATPVATSPSAPTPDETRHARDLSRAFRSAAERVLPAVVMIQTTGEVEQVAPAEPDDESADSNQPDDNGADSDDQQELLRQHPELAPQLRRAPHGPGAPHFNRMGLGSGVVIDPSGIILTNNHVVAAGGRIRVRLHDGRVYTATDVQTDPKSDLAILRIEADEPLPSVRLGDSDTMQVGDWVLALGQPFGLEGTVTSGIISAKGRGLGITARENFLQTDAAINPGNSGGPLVNLDGEVIGINTAISSQTGSYSGVGFAVPINLARWVSHQLVQSGTVHRAFLGVAIQPVTHELAQEFGVKVNGGVLITQIYPDTPAAEAGMAAGDIVVEFAGRAVGEPRELQGLVEQAPIGSRQKLVVLRGGQRVSLELTCREQPAEFGTFAIGQNEPQREDSATESARFDRFGLEVGPLTHEVAQHLGLPSTEGVVIVSVDANGAAAQLGLAPGMVIAEVDRQPVHSLDDFRTAVAANADDSSLLLLVRTAAGSRYLVLEAGE